VPLVDASPESEPTSPERIAALVRSLVDVMRDACVTELDLTFGGVSVRLRRPHDEPSEAELPRAGAVSLAARESAEGHVITAPMIGTFYASSSPGAAPFVREGDAVEVGQTIGIIEAMKIMNEIAADRAGTVEAILVQNGQPVEYGSPLLRLTPQRRPA
jgi:acetyl-CoA carboxylase biotin carboxyl carrier protein